jgi:hypothetical protein
MGGRFFHTFLSPSFDELRRERPDRRYPGLAGSQLLVSLNARNYKQAGTGFLGFSVGDLE